MLFVTKHYIKATNGFSLEVLYQAAKFDDCKEMENHVIILLDEICIMEKLVWSFNQSSASEVTPQQEES